MKRMHPKRLGYSWLMLVILLLAACQGPALNEAPDVSTPLITDADFAAAELELALDITPVTMTDAGDVPDGVESVLPDVIESVDDGDLTSQAVLAGASGYLAYSRFDHLSGRYQLWLANQKTDAKTLVYTGSNFIWDVTVTLDGNTLFFTSSSANSSGLFQYDLYRLVVSTSKLTRLTNTQNSDELAVSVSANGKTLVWEGDNPFNAGKRAIFIRQYGSSGFSDSVLTSSASQTSPTVSGDGNYIAFRRYASGKYRLLLYNKTNASYKTVFTSRDYFYAPSPSNGGKKVAWANDDNIAPTNQVRVKDIATGNTKIVLTDSNYIPLVHFTADGNYLAFAAYRNVNEFDVILPIYTKDLTTGKVARAVPGSTAADIYDLFWQK